MRIPKAWVEVKEEKGRFRPYLCFDDPMWEPYKGPVTYNSYELAALRGEEALKKTIGLLAETCN